MTCPSHFAGLLIIALTFTVAEARAQEATATSPASRPNPMRIHQKPIRPCVLRVSDQFGISMHSEYVDLGPFAGRSILNLARNIENYAVWRNVAIGTYAPGHEPNERFFILSERDSLPFLEEFEDQDKWLARRGELAIPDDVALLDPYAVAATRPATERYPGDYRYMKALLGRSDEEWGSTFTLAALVTSVVTGLVFGWRRRGHFVIVAVGLALGCYMQLTGDIMCCAAIPAVLLLYIPFGIACAVRALHTD